jgi:hypothetical protein
METPPDPLTGSGGIVLGVRLWPLSRARRAALPNALASMPAKGGVDGSDLDHRNGAKVP